MPLTRRRLLQLSRALDWGGRILVLFTVLYVSYLVYSL
jgi:hypothetical protein